MDTERVPSAKDLTPSTAQQRAEQLYDKLGRGSVQDVKTIAAHDKKTRQATLMEARAVLSRVFDEAKSEKADYYCALLDAGNELDRLASEGA